MKNDEANDIMTRYWEKVVVTPSASLCDAEIRNGMNSVWVTQPL